MSILHHLDPQHPSDNIPRYKNVCCMKYTIEDKTCARCPFRQIEDPEAQEKAMNEIRDKRRGTYEYEDLKIEYNNNYR